MAAGDPSSEAACGGGGSNGLFHTRVVKPGPVEDPFADIARDALQQEVEPHPPKKQKKPGVLRKASIPKAATLRAQSTVPPPQPTHQRRASAAPDLASNRVVRQGRFEVTDEAPASNNPSTTTTPEVVEALRGGSHGGTPTNEEHAARREKEKEKREQQLRSPQRTPSQSPVPVEGDYRPGSSTRVGRYEVEDMIATAAASAASTAPGTAGVGAPPVRFQPVRVERKQSAPSPSVTSPRAAAGGKVVRPAPVSAAEQLHVLAEADPMLLFSALKKKMLALQDESNKLRVLNARLHQDSTKLLKENDDLRDRLKRCTCSRRNSLTSSASNHTDTATASSATTTTTTATTRRNSNNAN